MDVSDRRLTFVFQNGTIKSKFQYYWKDFAHIFQFQYGTIKSRDIQRELC